MLKDLNAWEVPQEAQAKLNDKDAIMNNKIESFKLMFPKVQTIII